MNVSDVSNRLNTNKYSQKRISFQKIKSIPVSQILTISFFCFVFLLFIIMRDLLDINIPSSIYSIIALLGFILLNKGIGVSFLVFMLPYKNGIGYNEILLVYALVYIVKYRETIKISSPWIIVMILFAIEMQSLFQSSGSIMEILRFFIYFFIPCLVLQDEFDNNEIKRIIVACCLGIASASLIALLITVKYTNWDIVFSGAIRIGLTNQFISGLSTTFNPNEMGVFLCLAMSLVFTLLNRSQVNRFSGLVLLILLFFLGLLSQSRGFLISLLLMLSYFILFTSKSIRSFLNRLFILVISSAFTWVIYERLLFNTVNAFVLRFSATDVTNGRVGILLGYYNLWLSDLRAFFIGYSQQTYQMFGLRAGIANVAHNAIMELLISWGIIGTILTIMWVIILVKKQLLFRGKIAFAKIDKVIFLPLFTLVVLVQNGQFISNYSYVILMMVAILSIREINIKSERKSSKSSIYHPKKYREIPYESAN